MKKEKIGYFALKDIFYECSVGEFYKLSKTWSYMMGLFIGFFVMGMIILFLYDIGFVKNVLFTITIVSSPFLLLYLLFRTESNFDKVYPNSQALTSKSQLYWRGYRIVMFHDKLKGYKFNKKKMIERIDSEIDLCSFSVLKEPVMLLLLPIGLLIAKSYLDMVKSDLSETYLYGVFGVYLCIMAIVITRFSAFQTKEMILKEFKYFLLQLNEVEKMKLEEQSSIGFLQRLKHIWREHF